MSPHAVNNFVSDLVLMAQAMEKLPQVERERDEWMDKANEHLRSLINRDADLEQSRSYAATLEQKVHNLEVARDDAELSFLEADERTSRALDFVKALFGNAGALIQALEPPKAAAPQAEAPSKPEPLTELNVTHDWVAAQLDSHPVSLSGPSKFDDGGPYNEATPQGQREPDPTSATLTASQSVPTAQHLEQDVMASSQLMPSATPAEEAPPNGPYHGKNYYDWSSVL